MPLDTQPIEIIMTGGINTAVDEKILPANSLLSLTNGFYPKHGRIEKRTGFEYMSDQGAKRESGTVDLETPHNLYSYKNELLADITCEFQDRRLYSYSPAIGKWSQKDKVSEAVIERHSAFRGQAYLDETATAYCNGYVLYAWQDVVNIRAKLVDATTRATVYEWAAIQTTSAPNYAYPQIIVQGNSFYVFYRDTTIGAAEFICFRKLDTTSVTTGFGTQTEVHTMDAGYYSFAVAPASATEFIVVYSEPNTAPGGHTSLIVCRRSYAAPTVNIKVWADTTPNYLINHIGLVGPLNTESPGNIFVAYLTNPISGGGKTVHATALNGTTFSILSSDDIDTPASQTRGIGIHPIDASWCVVSWVEDGYASVTEPSTHWKGYDYISGEVSTNEGIQYNVSQCSQFFKAPNDTDNTGKLYWIGKTRGSAQPLASQPDSNYVLLELVAGGNYVTFTESNCRVVAIMSPRLAGAGRVSCVLAPVSPNGTTKIETGLAVGINTEAYGTSIGFDGFTLVFEDTFMHSGLGNLTGIAGGILQLYDSNSLVESNFLIYPTGITTTLAGGSGLSEGAYQYKVVYEWRDSLGNLYESAPTPETISITTDASQKQVVMYIPTISLTHKHITSNELNKIVIAVYRTEVGQTVYKRLYAYEETPSALFNDPTKAYVQFTDTVADADLGQPLYTTGGRLEIVCPPSTRFAIQHKRRIWLISAEDPTTLWFSQEIVKGETPGFHELLTINFPYDGEIIGLGSFDDKLVVFKRDSIWAIFGEGPGDNGTNSDLSTPILVSKDTGCIDRRSIVNGFGGIFFQGSKGIYRITPSLQLEYVGSPIESAFADSTVRVTSAVYIPNRNQMLFSLSGTSGIIYVFDTVRGAWSKWDYVDSDDPVAILSSVCVNGIYYTATNSKILYQHSTVVYKDRIGRWAATVPTYNYIPMTIETPWIRVGALQNYQRVKRISALMEDLGYHNLTMTLDYDYCDGYGTYETWTNEQIDALPDNPIEQLETHVPRQKCQSIKVKLVDSPRIPTGGGTIYYDSKGYTLSALTLMAGIKRGMFKKGYVNKK